MLFLLCRFVYLSVLAGTFGLPFFDLAVGWIVVPSLRQRIERGDISAVQRGEINPMAFPIEDQILVAVSLPGPIDAVRADRVGENLPLGSGSKADDVLMRGVRVGGRAGFLPLGFGNNPPNAVQKRAVHAVSSVVCGRSGPRQRAAL